MPWRPGMTVAQLLDELRYTFPRLIVSVDGELVLPEEYDRCSIDDGACVSVIHMMAGG